MPLKRQGLYQNARARLEAQPWGTKIIDAETSEPKDTGVNPAMQEIAALLMSGKLELNEPIKIYSNITKGPIFEVYDQRGGNQFMTMINEQNQFVSIGIGAYTEGIIANEFIPVPWYSLPPDEANDAYGNTGGNDTTPGSGTGNGNGTGYGDPSSTEGSSGWNTGYPGSSPPISPPGGFGMGFYNAPDINMVLGQVTLIIDEVKDDYLVCEHEDSGKLVDVAKGREFRKSLYDGVAGGDITYDYSQPNSRTDTRRASDACDNTEDQYVQPPYEEGDVVYAVYVSNGTGVENDDGDEIWFLETNQRMWLSEKDEENCEECNP